jgi:hypothetical protein
MLRPSHPSRKSTSERAYEPPKLNLLGSVGELTAGTKKDGPSDGFALVTAQGIIPITNAS